MKSRIGKFLANLVSLGAGYTLLLFLVVAQILGVQSDRTEEAPMKRYADFPIFYAAGALALAGKAVDAYDNKTIIAQDAELTGSSKYFRFSYPPTALTFFAPFAALPPAVAFFTWVVTWVGFACFACYRAIPRRSTVFFAVFFSGTGYSAICGQNGALSAGLLTMAISFFERNAIVAGVALGLLTYKPQMAVLPIGLALLLGRFQVIAVAAAVVTVMAILSTALFGFDTWYAFLRESFMQSQDVSKGALHAHQVSLFVLMRKITDNLFVCYSTAILAGIVCIAAVWLLWRRTDDLFLRSLALAAAIPIATPYVNDYDMAILVLPFVIASQKLADLERPHWVVLALPVTLTVVPLSASAVLAQISISPAPIILLGLLIFAYIASLSPALRMKIKHGRDVGSHLPIAS